MPRRPPSRHTSPPRARLTDSPADVTNSGFGEIADRLLAVGYDQALSDMLKELDYLSGLWGIDFNVHIAEMLAETDPDVPVPHLTYRGPRR